MTDYEQAVTIATKNLRACYQKDGIIAGPHHFTDYWARDGYFAAFGSLMLEDQTVITRMVDLFFKHQNNLGQIPYRIMRGPVTLRKYFGKPSQYAEPKPTYKLRNIGKDVFDGTTLSIMFAAKLSMNHLLPQVLKGLTYLESKEVGGLLNDGPMGEWNDVVWKWGRLLYSNVIYYKSLASVASWPIVKNTSHYKVIVEKKNQVRKHIVDLLWNGRFFSDWHDHQRQDYLYPFGNCLAIIWGLTTPTQTKSILAECKHLKINFSLETNYPKYPWWRVDLGTRLAGMADYQNKGLIWWQPITAYALALKTSGHLAEYQEIEKQIIAKLIEDQSVFECYERNGKPVKRPLYQAENPFAWASGMILWALKSKSNEKFQHTNT